MSGKGMTRFGRRVRPWAGPVLDTVKVGAVGPEMIEASRNGWFDNPDEMFYMGHGAGEMGRMAGKAEWVYALANEDSIQPVGIYAEGQPAGYVLFAPNPGRKIMNVTLWVHPSRRRQRVGTSALARVLDGLFKRGVYRVETEVLRCDDRARAFLVEFGMKREGHRIRSLWADGKAFDTTMYRVLLPDWQAREDDSYWRGEA